jgi:RimJ/RimL family protein N-acetyltransferase
VVGRSLSPTTLAPLPDVTTERLVLERFRPRDENELARVFANPEVWRFPYGRGLSREETGDLLRAQIDHWKTFGFGCWVAREAATGCIVGYVGL